MAERLEPPTRIALFLLRLWVGLNFAIVHGWPKLQDTSQFLESAQVREFPMSDTMGWIAMLSEALGGLLLAIGFLTRPAAALLLFTMLGAIFVVHDGDPWKVKELAYTYAVILLVFLARGGGEPSVDAWIEQRRRKRSPW